MTFDEAKIGMMVRRVGTPNVGRIIEKVPPSPSFPDSPGSIRVECLGGALNMSGPPSAFEVEPSNVHPKR